MSTPPHLCRYGWLLDIAVRLAELVLTESYNNAAACDEICSDANAWPAEAT
jgi:hypothetical protein